MAKTYDILHPKIAGLIEGASGKYPTQTGTKLNADLFVSVTLVSRDNRLYWALIFTKANSKGAFNLKYLGKDVQLEGKYVINKRRGKAVAADIFTRLAVEKLAEVERERLDRKD